MLKELCVYYISQVINLPNKGNTAMTLPNDFKKKLIVIFLISLGTHVSSTAAVPLEVTIQETIEEFDIPAMAAMTIYGDKIVDSAVAGVRVRGTDEKATLDDLWHLGSCTKSMTATCAGRLIEKGILKWESTIAETLPEFGETILPAYRNVTLRELLEHRSGIPGDVMQKEMWKDAFERVGSELSAHEQHRLFCRDTLQLEPHGKIGTYQYSNQGYAVAGYMCAVAANDTFENVMQRELFEPLNMKSVGYGSPLSRGDKNLCGHTGEGKPVLLPFDNPIGMAPAGLVHCTMEDWSKYAAEHLLGSKGKSDLLSKQTFDSLHTPSVHDENAYAVGWIATTRPWGNGRVLTHSGSNTMFFCTVWIAPNRNFAVLVACNQGPPASTAACDAVVTTCIVNEIARQNAFKSNQPKGD
jgi:CubicO group peptidase (beta-lactamase class C family)